MVIGIVVACIFFLIGIYITFFGHRIILWLAYRLLRIWRNLGIEDEPWARGTWPFGLSVSCWIFRIMGAIFAVASAYALYLLIS